MRKILVTGGAGFIGSFLVDKLVALGNKVTVYDNLDPQVHPGGTAPDYLNPEARLVKADVRDYNTLKREVLQSEIVVHYAAAVGVGQSQYMVRHYTDVNCGGTANLLDILANSRHSVEKVIVASSMSCYGEGKYICRRHGNISPDTRKPEDMETGSWEMECPLCSDIAEPVPTDEFKKLDCTSIYAMTKRDQEEMTLNIGRTYGIPAVALRFFNVYGPRQSLSNPYTGVAAIFLSRIKNGKPPVIFEDGNQSRDFVSVHDIVQASVLAIEKDEANYQAFNVGTGRKITISEVAVTLARLLGSDIEPLITGRFRKGDIRHCYADITKIRDTLGYKPVVSFEDGMRELVEWSAEAEANDSFETAEYELTSRGIA